jgi:penicillin G amidase
MATSDIRTSGALPRMDGTVRLPGITEAVSIRRDAYGIPHIEAQQEADAWFGMGYACAQDRLWQLEWYRRRGTGRWAEVAGAGAVAGDRLFRRFALDAASQADVLAMSAPTRAMFEAYAAGVNACVAAADGLPPEFGLADIDWEPWEPWHSVLVFKVRHAIMGKRLLKLARMEILRRAGPDAYALLEGQERDGLPLILPPGGRSSRGIDLVGEELRAMAADLDTLGQDEGGSNSWAVHGSRTSTGKPVLVNDSHRPLDTPNVYWQVHVTYPGVNAAGGAFPGFPAFPHFGFTGHLGWNITHGQADYQDLVLEQFDPKQPGRYRTESGWNDAEVTRSEIGVRGGDPVPVEHVRTRHGDIVHGDPASGIAVAMRYTATDRPNRQWETLRPMLTARTVAELHETQRGWEEPVNAILSADTDGNIGFLFRGRVPVRSSPAARQFPAFGWLGHHEWTGDVPFEALPQAINPAEGYLGTANQRPHDAVEPYLGFEFTVPGRAARIAEVFGDGRVMTPEEIASYQGDTLSIRSRDWARFLAGLGPFEGDAERARAMLAAWDGDLRADSGPALLYACARISIAEAVFRPIAGEAAWTWLFSGENDNGPAQVGRWLYHLGGTLDGSTGTPDGRPWESVLPDALGAAWKRATELGGGDSSKWRWADVHRTSAKHPLSGIADAAAGTLDPPAVGVGGDGDTLQVSGYSIAAGSTLGLTNLSVYRQVVDFAAPEEASWIIPAGASGIPGTPHYADQIEHWRTHQRIPMHHRIEDARAAAVTTLTLEPAG